MEAEILNEGRVFEPGFTYRNYLPGYGIISFGWIEKSDGTLNFYIKKECIDMRRFKGLVYKE